MKEIKYPSGQIYSILSQCAPIHYKNVAIGSHGHFTISTLT